MEAPPEARPALAPGVRRQTDAITGQEVLLFPEGILELNETAGAVLRLCDGVATVGQIALALGAEYDAPAEELLADVQACLGELVQRQLLVWR